MGCEIPARILISSTGSSNPIREIVNELQKGRLTNIAELLSEGRYFISSYRSGGGLEDLRKDGYNVMQPYILNIVIFRAMWTTGKVSRSSRTPHPLDTRRSLARMESLKRYKIIAAKTRNRSNMLFYSTP